MSEPPPLTLVNPVQSDPDRLGSSFEPPRPLGQEGRALWDRVQDEFDITDCAGREILAQCCEAQDRIQEIAERIRRDGLSVQGQRGFRANPLLKDELLNRAFLVRTLQRLGLNLEPVGRVGVHRNGKGLGWLGDRE